MMYVALAALLLTWSDDTTEITTGLVRETIQNTAQTQESRIAYAYYPTRVDMPAYQRKINEVISTAVPFRMSDEDAPAAVQNLTKEFFAGALRTMSNRYRDYVTSMPDGNEAPWVLIDSTLIYDDVLLRGKQTDIAQVVRYRYEFTGGAHGNSSIAVTLISKTTGKELTFAKDLLSDPEAFEKIAEKYFRKERKIPAKQSLKKAGYWFDQGFGLSENVLLSNDAVTLIYNPYECAPYVMGEIRVAIPLKDIEKCISIPQR